MKKAALLWLSLSACTKELPPQVSLEIIRVGQATTETNAGAKTFPLVFTAGNIVLDQLNLVDLEAIEETPMLAAPLSYDFFREASISVAPVLVVPGQYEQVHVIPNNDAISVSMTFTVTLSDNSALPGELSLQLPFVDEEQIDAPLDIQENDQKRIVLAFDPAKLFNGVDFDSLNANGSLLLSPENPDPAVIDAVAIIVENVFTSFALVSAQ